MGARTRIHVVRVSVPDSGGSAGRSCTHNGDVLVATVRRTLRASVGLDRRRRTARNRRDLSKLRHASFVENLACVFELCARVRVRVRVRERERERERAMWMASR